MNNEQVGEALNLSCEGAMLLSFFWVIQAFLQGTWKNSQT